MRRPSSPTSSPWPPWSAAASRWQAGGRFVLNAVGGHRDRDRRRLRRRASCARRSTTPRPRSRSRSSRLLRLPAGRGARRLGGPGRGDGRDLPRLALAGAHHARPRGSRPSRCGRSSSSSSTPLLFMLVGLQLPTVIDGLSRMSTGSILVRRRCRQRRGHRHPLPLGLPRHLRAAPALAPGARARPAALAVPGHRGLDRACAARCRWPRRWPSRRRSTPAAPFPQRDLIIFLTYAVILAR